MAESRSAGVDLTGIHVLVIDDDDEARFVMHSTLRYFGALVVSVPSVKRAFRAMYGVRPDVVVSDLRMPEEDGFAFIREVRSLPLFRSVPVIAISGYDHLYGVGAIGAAGFNAMLRKPIDPPELARAVAAVVRRPAP